MDDSIDHKAHRRSRAQFSVSVRCDGRSITVRIRGELDLATAPILEGSLYPFREREEMLLFDMSGVDFVDVVGIKPIVILCERDEARIGLTSRSVRRLLSLIGTKARIDRWLTPSASLAVGF